LRTSVVRRLDEENVREALASADQSSDQLLWYIPLTVTGPLKQW